MWCDGSSLKRSSSLIQNLKDMLVGREAMQGLAPTGMIVGVHEQLEAGLELFVRVVVALDRRVLDRAVHRLNLAVIRHGRLGAFAFR
jgi:hypothetical protein